MRAGGLMTAMPTRVAHRTSSHLAGSTFRSCQGDEQAQLRDVVDVDQHHRIGVAGFRLVEALTTARVMGMKCWRAPSR